MNEPIEIHIFGGRIGESIAIRLPEDQWGVVDNYTPKLDEPFSNPTFRFLRDRKVERLKFVGLTHPHLDHYRGLSHLLETFNPESVWIFAAMTHRDLYEKVVEVIHHKATSSHLPIDEPNRDELVRILDWIRNRQIRAPRLDVRRLELHQTLLEMDCEPAIKITAIGAPGGQALLYEESLSACFTSNGDFLKDRVPDVNHNLISGGILIEYGEARIVLGGDIEKVGWEETMRFLAPQGRLRARLVKASHHGSSDGYCDGLWNQFSPAKSAIAVITPYTAKSLPSREGLSHIAAHAESTFTVSVKAVSLANDWSQTSETPFSGVSIDALMALRALFPNVRSNRQRLEGVCSFKIAANGTITHTQSGEAGRL